MKNIEILTKIHENPDVGSEKVTVENVFFFLHKKALLTMTSLKSNKCHVYDNILLLVLKDGAELLATPFT